jgi:hypothetical protein
MQTYTTKQAAEFLTANGRKVSENRIRGMLRQDQNPNRKITHFPSAIKQRRDWIIFEKDLKNYLKPIDIL